MPFEIGVTMGWKYYDQNARKGIYRRITLLGIDGAIIVAMYGVIAWISTFSFSSLSLNGDFSLVKLLLLFSCITFLRLVFNIYTSIWRYANMVTYLKLMVSDLLGGAMFFLIGRINSKVSLGFAYSVLVVLMILLVTLASRFVYHFLFNYFQYSTHKSFRWFSGEDEKDDEQIHRINIAIVGAGDVGVTLAESLARNPRAHYTPKCFIDIDGAKVGGVINGIPVYQENDKTIELIKRLPVQEIVIALPNRDVETINRLYDLYGQTNCKIKLYDRLPNDGLKDREASRTENLRMIQIEDLLPRSVRSVVDGPAKEFYKGKTVLITGGGGSIGSELCRQVAMLQPKQMIILDIYENNAYDIQQELLRTYGDNINLKVVIASVRDEVRLEEIFAEICPDIVFHAAAHKHVPLMEESSCEAIKNNVFGTYHVANLAEKYGVQKFVLISTDKAVNPTNIMGASKRLCEMIIQCRADSKTEFTAVRFGNVLGSNGSVIPLFRRQIEAGGPITITDKRIVRYFMTIPEAVSLVLETGAIGHGGELYVLNMGRPVKILDLAEKMVQLSGLKPYEDIPIVEVGLRPGEKLYEELLMDPNRVDKTEDDMIFIERDKGCTRAEVEEKLKVLKKALTEEGDESTKNGHYAAVVRAVRATVPTYFDAAELNNTALSGSDENGVHIGDRRL